MFVRIVGISALVVAALSYLLSGINASAERPPYIQGRNKTVLFLTNAEHGLNNVLVATASSLMEHHPDVEVHFASFPALQSTIERISSAMRRKTPASRDILFHPLSGVALSQATAQIGMTARTMTHPPAAAGIAKFADIAQGMICPWTADEYIDIFNELGALIDDINPAVIVLDTLFRPAVDITRQKNWLHAFITPNTLIDNFLAEQPNGAMFWKYPAISSGFSFPVPLRQIPENIYLNARVIYALMYLPALSAVKAVLRSNGIQDPLNFYALRRDDVPWITQSTEGASIPVDYVPPNVTCAGPIVLSAGSAAEQDPELAAWLKKAPTVLINLGSMIAYDEIRARVMASAVADVLAEMDVQFIWKARQDTTAGDFDWDAALAPLKPFIEAGRVRVFSWLTVDPASLLDTGDIVASVHHGGANCYHETIASGVAHLILPVWVDLYSFAALAEDMGVGVWGCRATSPDWTRECLRDSLLDLLDKGPVAQERRDAARILGDNVRKGGKGKDIAAGEIAKLACVR
ncbi:hypothetical protein F5X68DRAFT_209414 [Plectosphaerella plurivora]|uniref:Uncharacterized protein n=1 Tax=Plectosphaerella plurivora TaxID=936078 RepID=A0A9P8V8C0_9PEZI|nr:hypothetical protein F5X68DRAFT_209414 [Plectosphaerella plurivora]